MRALALLLCGILALAACNRTPGTAAPRNWATQVVAGYYETRGDGAAIARMADSGQVENALNSLRQSLGDERNARIGSERIGFLLEYPPIWKSDHLDATQWDARRARIALLPDTAIGQWRAALGAATGAPPSELWTIGYLIDTPSLFKSDGFDAQRSALLLERLQKLSSEATGLVSATLHLDKAWAAMLIVQNDDFFHNADIDPDKFAAAVAALGDATSPQPATRT